MALTLVNCKTQEDLYAHVRHSPLDRRAYGGSTDDPERRRGEHERGGYRGTMYYAPTTNMKKAEDDLLTKFRFHENQQQQSNAAKATGYIYAIITR